MKGYNVTMDSTGSNDWKTFYDNGVFYVFQVIIIGSNTALLTLLAYAILNVANISKQWIHYVGIGLEVIGALGRVIFFIDPSGCYRLIPTQISSAIFYTCFPFTLMNCLLLALYFQEIIKGKDVKVSYFIKRTQWLFYLICGILLVLIIIIPITRTFVIFDTIRIVVILGFALISALVGVLYVVTAIQLFITLQKMKNNLKKSQKQLLATRFIVTGIVLAFMIFTMVFSRLARTPPVVELMGSMVVAAITVVGLICAVGLVALSTTKDKKKETKTKATQTGTKGRSTRGDTVKGNDDDSDDDSDDDDDDKEGGSKDKEKKESKEEDLKSLEGDDDDDDKEGGSKDKEKKDSKEEESSGDQSS